MCCDMSLAFIKGVREYFPETKLTFDKFHIVKVINDALAQVRCEERKNDPELSQTRYIWLKNPENLTIKQRERLKELKISRSNLKTVRGLAYQVEFSGYFQPFPPCRRRRISVEEMVFLGDSQPFNSYEGSSLHHKTPLGRSSAVVSVTYQQRHT